MTREQLTTLTEMLTYARPCGSSTEAEYIARYIACLPDATEDVHGNYHVTVGTSSILWSAHTDTVHRCEGRQTLRVNEREYTIRLSRRSKRAGVSCLGADDTVGCFILREMILAGIPGRYVFHYGEECGGIGSGNLAAYTPELLDGVKFAIALDRQGTCDIITSQLGGTCASEAFAHSLAAQLPGRYASASGTFTDTANYTDIVPECSNPSVGYYHAHSSREYVDYAHVGHLLHALCNLNPDLLVCARDPHARRIDLWPVSRPSSRSRDVSLFAPIYTSSLSDATWCDYCDAPIIDPGEDYPALGSFCVCSDDDDYRDLSPEDAKFLRYLRDR